MKDGYFYKSLFSTLFVWLVLTFILVVFVIYTGIIGIFVIVLIVVLSLIYFYSGSKKKVAK